MDQIDILRLSLYIVIAVALISTIAFPILYSHSPWWRSWTGRALMYREIAYSTLMLGAIYLYFWPPGNEGLRLSLYLVLFFVLATGSASALYILWRVNYAPRRLDSRKKVEDGRK